MLNAASLWLADGSPELADTVGRFLVVGFEGQERAELERLILGVRPAGLIFFKRNYPGTPARLRALIDFAQQLAEASLSRSLFIGIDNEGGLVRRLPGPYTQLPPAAEIASDLQAIKQLNYQSARELAATGFNFNFAPVLDVATCQGSFMGSRSFSEDPFLAAECAKACLAALHSGGLLGAGKHFPGLGTAVLDPHQELPTISSGLHRLRAVDLLPFRALMDMPGGLEAIMSTHVLYPAFDAEKPATFSADIIGLLKGEMGFAGAVLTDDLEMGAVVKNYPMGEAAAAAVEAGHDLALVCRKASYIKESIEALAQATRSGRLNTRRIEDAARRTARLATRLKEIRPPRRELDGWFAELESAGPAEND